MLQPRLCTRTILVFCRDSTRRSDGHRPLSVILQSRLNSSTPDSGFKDTTPSSSKPSGSRSGDVQADEGYLAFTKSLLYKLTLPLAPPSGDSPSPAFKVESESNQKYDSNGNENGGDANVDKTWEQQVEKGKEPFHRRDSNDGKHLEGPQSVVFLLHSGQPLSYIANLIRAEQPETEPGIEASKQEEQAGERERKLARSRNPLGEPPITFHTSMQSKRRWSPSTGIGDFLREAARIGSFTIVIGSRRVRVIVPSFEERTRFLRSSLHQKTKRIERLAHVKDDCDKVARRATQRYAFAGAGVMASWWLTVGTLTFKTSLGWDVMEPVTYLTGFGMVISSYIWFLWHNREVSYRTVLTETTSRRQQKMYAERGFDVDAYHELINEAKGLRKAIKRVAWDYELEWDQGDTEAGRSAKRALQIMRREEERDTKRSRREEEDERQEDDAYAQVDDDADGQPDRKS